MSTLINQSIAQPILEICTILCPVCEDFQVYSSRKQPLKNHLAEE